MRKTATLMTLVLIVSTVASVPLTGAATHGTDTHATTSEVAAASHPENGTANDSANVTPGGQLMGVIGVQQSELDGEMEERTFGLKVASAASNESEAAVVAEQFEALQERLENLSERKQELREAHQNGSISDAEYSAEMAKLAAETKTVERLANATENESEGLPESLLEEKGINVTAIQTLKSDAENLTGPEVAAIAHSIAGPNVGTDIADEHRPDESDSGDQNESETERGDDQTTPADGETTTGNETASEDEETTTTTGNDQGDSDR